MKTTILILFLTLLSQLGLAQDQGEACPIDHASVAGLNQELLKKVSTVLSEKGYTISKETAGEAFELEINWNTYLSNPLNQFAKAWVTITNPEGIQHVRQGKDLGDYKNQGRPDVTEAILSAIKIIPNCEKFAPKGELERIDPVKVSQLEL